jgi:hypothetical protein
MDLDMPLDNRKLEAENIIQHIGMLDWREEVEYLRSQMTREQNSSLGTWDSRQKKRDDRILNEELLRKRRLWKQICENAK